ncbi:MAG: carboxypeptidase M32 [Syntrophobacteraceae bacterium]
MRPKKAYQWLVEHHRETARYDSIRELLGWDQRTCLPPAGQSHRAAQLATLAGLLARRKTNPKIGEMLAEVEGSGLVHDPLSDESVNVREWRRIYDRSCRIPEALAVELARAASECEMVWQAAKPKDDWYGFLPHLEYLVSLKREEAGMLSVKGEIYDALIEEFEPGETARTIEAVFDRLAKPLVELLDRIRGSAKKPDPGILLGDSPVRAQKALIRHIVERIGYDLDSGRIDRSAHPFTSTIGPGDVRITTRYEKGSFAEALLSAVHEAGHALYEQGLPVAHWGTPRGAAVSMAIHESQSLMWENIVGRSAGFWKRFHPAARKHLPWLAPLPFDSFHLALNAVRPGLIRTEADEVTYNLHVIMRFELERALIGRDLEPEYLPEAWNEKMWNYLGLVPPDYASGVMQDVHWSGGAIGYFPSYALGTIYAAQFYAKAAQDLGDPELLFESGDFAPFVRWFRVKVHSQGSRYLPRDLLRAATGEDLDPGYLIDYLNGKYSELYGNG